MPIDFPFQFYHVACGRRKGRRADQFDMNRAFHFISLLFLNFIFYLNQNFNFIFFSLSVSLSVCVC